tara:strand:+ start:358 stop:597 length:240 start_codon:yes stop_codon:yes gene_type:complete
MQTITLKLTKSEWELFEGKYNQVKMFCQGKDFVLDVLDVDKFREFLNDESNGKNVELGRITMSDYNNLKSILSKLDKAI